MNPDVLGTVIALFTLVVTVLGGVGVMIAHQTKMLEPRFDAIDARFDVIDARFDAIDARFGAVESRFGTIESRLSRIEEEVVEVKITIARWEGPRRQLQL